MRYTRIGALLVISIMVFWSATAFAKGQPDRVSGRFDIVSCCPTPVDPLIRHREYFVKEATDQSPQSGYMYSVHGDDLWYMIDFSDMENTCINVYGDGLARLGGLVSDGNVGAVGKYFGFDLHDWHEKRYHQDSGRVFRFIGDDGGMQYPEPGLKENFMHWCHTGEHEFGVSVNVVWFQLVVKGNLKVHNTKTDGD